MRVMLIRAGRDTHRLQTVVLSPGARVRDALQACGIDLEGVVGHAVFGRRVGPDHVLNDGDRLELLEALRIDPKQARRQRAGRPDRGR